MCTLAALRQHYKGQQSEKASDEKRAEVGLRAPETSHVDERKTRVQTFDSLGKEGREILARNDGAELPFGRPLGSNSNQKMACQLAAVCRNAVRPAMIGRFAARCHRHLRTGSPSAARHRMSGWAAWNRGERWSSQEGYQQDAGNEFGEILHRVLIFLLMNQAGL